ncbi:MAG: hypothetical protein AAGN46_10315 [Acidobacteriota bacterium]
MPSAESVSRPLLNEVTRLFERSDSLELFVPQDTGTFAVDPALLEKIFALIDDTTNTLGELGDRLDAAAPEDLSEAAAGDGDVAQANLSPREVADLAFVARAELTDLRRLLQAAVDRRNAWKIAAEADRALHRVPRSLIPIEAALRHWLGEDPIERRSFDLDDALEIRRQYARLWLEAHRLGDVDSVEVRDRLRHFADLLAMLRRNAIYPYLRIDDRYELRQLQKRILGYLDDDGADAETGRRMWQDLVGFVSLLMQISRREELREHDRLLVARTLRSIAKPLGPGPTGDDPLDASVTAALRDLASLEPSLDEILVRSTPQPAAAFVGPLGRLRDRMARR